jgi:hypothetical protein
VRFADCHHLADTFMTTTPFLLQAFAARMLASKLEESVSRQTLVEQGYDVEMLVEMINECKSLPESDRTFVVSADAMKIHIARKWKNTAPHAPAISVPQQPPVSGAPAVPQPPAIISLAGLVKRADSSKANGSAKKPV